MLIKDLFLGDVEGADEFGNASSIENLYFMGIEEDDINDLLDGRLRYIHGYKGTGKTSLIKLLENRSSKKNIPYISLSYRKLREDAGFITEFRGFMDEYKTTDELINEFRGNFNSLKKLYGEMDDKDTATLAFWEWYLLSIIASKYAKANSDNLIFSTGLTFFKSLAKIMNMLTISVDAAGTLTYGINIQSINTREDETLTNAAEKMRELTNQIRSNLTKKVIIFIDELELTKARGTYGTDRIIIKNLVLATNKINKISKNLHIVLAIRDEVLYDLRGDEINKLRDDYGLSMNWWSNERASVDHRLWMLMFKKIKYSMKEHGENVDISNKVLWDRWFPFDIDGKESWKFFFELTWARPRDFVRLLSLMQQACRKQPHFTRACYDSIAKKYSQSAYDEVREELSTIFDDDKAKMIERIVQSIGSNFTLTQFVEAAKNYKLENPEETIEEMYRVGFVGNHYKLPNGGTKWRFFYRGDDTPDKTKVFEVHRALQEALGVKETFNKETFHREENNHKEESFFSLKDKFASIKTID
jgi:hypothetical protein